MRNWCRTVAGSFGTVTVRGDRATATLEDIRCEKIRGCSLQRRQHVFLL
jgi:hypothetical protein